MTSGVAPQPCPRCANPLAGGDGWVAWCPVCEHGLVNEARTKPGWLRRRRDHRRRRGDASLVAGIAAGGRPGRATAALATVAATGVHLLTAATLGVGVWLLVVGGSPLLYFFGGLLIVIAAYAGPRISVDRGAASELPGLRRLVAEIATAAGCTPPDRCRVDLQYNASITYRFDRRLRRVSVLTVGAPLWAALGPQARVAMLAHEVGHAVGGDPGRSWWVGGAVGSLRRWQSYVLPTRTPEMRRRLSASGLGGRNSVVLEWLTGLLLAPIFLLVGLVARGYEAVVFRQRRRCELLADQVSARVAGRDAAREALEAPLLEPVVVVALSSARARGDRTPGAELVRRAVHAVPALEVERRLRRERLLGDGRTRTHPPTFRRIELVDRLPDLPAAYVPDPAVLAAADADVVG